MIKFPSNYEHINLWDLHYAEMGYVRFRTERIGDKYYLTYRYDTKAKRTD